MQNKSLRKSFFFVIHAARDPNHTNLHYLLSIVFHELPLWANEKINDFFLASLLKRTIQKNKCKIRKCCKFVNVPHFLLYK